MLALGCAEPYDAQQVLLSTIEGDLPRLAEDIELVSTAASRLAIAGDEYNTRGGTVGDCRWDVLARGRPLEGELLSSLETTPCGGDVGPGGAFDLFMEEAALSGTWSGTALGEVTLDARAHRVAEVLDGPKPYDVSYVVPSLEVSLQDGAVHAWWAEIVYGNFAGEVWTLDVFVRQGVVVEGRLTGTDDCVVEGSVDAALLGCPEG